MASSNQFSKRNLPHFYLENPNSGVYPFRPKARLFEKKLAPKNERQKQAGRIKTQVSKAIKKGLKTIQEAEQSIVDARHEGFYLELKLNDAMNFIHGLEDATRKISIKNIKVLDAEKGDVAVVVYVPKKAAVHYINLADRYAKKTVDQSPTDKDETIARIDTVKQAMFLELYTDDVNKLPSANHIIWWEIWLDIEFKDKAIEIFEKLQIEFQSKIVVFAENCIYHVRASRRQLTKIIKSTGLISEVRLPQKEPGFFLFNLKPEEQVEWISNVLLLGLLIVVVVIATYAGMGKRSA